MTKRSIPLHNKTREVFEVVIRYDEPGMALPYLGHVRLVSPYDLDGRGLPKWDKFFQIAHQDLEQLLLDMGNKITEVLDD